MFSNELIHVELSSDFHRLMPILIGQRTHEGSVHDRAYASSCQSQE
jgi:hypothetical protein